MKLKTLIISTLLAVTSAAFANTSFIFDCPAPSDISCHYDKIFKLYNCTAKAGPNGMVLFHENSTKNIKNFGAFEKAIRIGQAITCVYQHGYLNNEGDTQGVSIFPYDIPILGKANPTTCDVSRRICAIKFIGA